MLLYEILSVQPIHNNLAALWRHSGISQMGEIVK